ncbi:MAG: hypothetical protein JW881_08785 [Spirochaetales bacterium]|nr:hypothetical protein [Spirochaetales bacterium]
MKRTNIAIICVIVISAVQLSGETGEQPFDYDDNHLFSGNVVKNGDESFVLGSIYILESGFAEGKYVTGDLKEQGFEKYDGKWLQNKKNLERYMYTFRTRFYVDERLRNVHLSLYMGMTGYPRAIYLNGRKIQTYGRYRDVYNTHAFLSHNIYLSEDILRYGNEINELAIQAYPEKDNLPLEDLTIGSYYKNEGEVFLRNFIGVSMMQVACITSFVIFLYMLFLFITMNFRDFSILYFGLTCLCYGLSYVNMAFLSDAVSQVPLEITSRAMFPWTGLFIIFFILEFTGIAYKNRILKIGLALPALILSVLPLFQTRLEGVAGIFLYTMGFLLVCVVFSIIVILISIIKKKNKKSIVILISFCFVLVTAYSDIYHVFQQIFPYAYIMAFGFFALVLSIFFLLAFDQAQIFKKSLKTAADLNKRNESLKKMVENIGIVSDNLNNSSKRLEEIVLTSTDVIGHYEKNNREIIERVFGKFNEIEETMKKVGARIDIATEKVPQAIINQTSIVEEISATITSMDQQMEQTMASAFDSHAEATQLQNLAENSTRIIKESKAAIATISEYSLFLREVLNAIEDITDKTSILSINAAIEAARQGIHGKGFSVISGEISNLSLNTKNTLETSFEKIKDMYELIERSTTLSDEVSTSLFTIIDKIKVSTAMIANITRLMQDQKSQASAILASVKSLLQDTVTIKELTSEEQEENEKVKQTLADLRDTFSAINQLLRDQLQKGTELSTCVDNIKDMTGQNLKNIDILKKVTVSANTSES